MRQLTSLTPKTSEVQLSRNGKHARSVANPLCNALSLLLKTNKNDSCRDPVSQRSRLSVLGPSGLSVDPSESAALLCSTVHCSSTPARAARSIIICLAPVAPVYVAVQKGVDTALRRLPEPNKVAPLPGPLSKQCVLLTCHRNNYSALSKLTVMQRGTRLNRLKYRWKWNQTNCNATDRARDRER